MNNLKKFLLAILFVSPLALSNCAQETVDPSFNPNALFEIEKAVIRRYLTEEVDVEEDTTEIGVRLVVLDQGNGAPIKPRDLVSFDFTGRVLREDNFGQLVDNDIFDTSVIDVAMNFFRDRLANDPTSFMPITYTYSSDGWTLTPLSGVVPEPGFVIGFSNGVTHLLQRINAGGVGEIVIPSRLAFGQRGTTSIAPNEIVIFRIENVEILN